MTLLTIAQNNLKSFKQSCSTRIQVRNKIKLNRNNLMDLLMMIVFVNKLMFRITYKKLIFV